MGLSGSERKPIGPEHAHWQILRTASDGRAEKLARRVHALAPGATVAIVDRFHEVGDDHDLQHQISDRGWFDYDSLLAMERAARAKGASVASTAREVGRPQPGQTLDGYRGGKPPRAVRRPLWSCFGRKTEPHPHLTDAYLHQVGQRAPGWQPDPKLLTWMLGRWVRDRQWPQWQALGSAKPIAAGGDRLRVTYVVPELVIAGGVLSVIQLVNGLTDAGIDAQIATTLHDPLVDQWAPSLPIPMRFRSLARMAQTAPHSDVWVATHWRSVATVAALAQRDRSAPAYFVQDYEPWFEQQGAAAADRARASYQEIEHRIVKSSWLCEHLAKRGFTSHKIALGLDLDIFRPGLGQPRRDILAMARPGTSYRGFDRLCQVLERMCDVSITLFGSAQLPRLSFEFHNAGLIVDRAALTRLYRSHKVFIDCSTFQGFGRCGLEAMACGCAAVLSGRGGVSEYARHGQNALVIDDDETASYTTALTRLLTNDELRQRLITTGLKTAEVFDLNKEISSTAAFFRALSDG